MPLLHGVLDVYVHEATVSSSSPCPLRTAPRHCTCFPAHCYTHLAGHPRSFLGAAQNLSSTYRIQVVGCMKRYICCGALPALAGSCDPYLCLDVGQTRCVNTQQGEGNQSTTWSGDAAALLSTAKAAVCSTSCHNKTLSAHALAAVVRAAGGCARASLRPPTTLCGMSATRCTWLTRQTPSSCGSR